MVSLSSLPNTSGPVPIVGDTLSEATLEENAPSVWTPPAWEDIVREHGDRVYRLAYRLAGNAHDA